MAASTGVPERGMNDRLTVTIKEAAKGSGETITFICGGVTKVFDIELTIVEVSAVHAPVTYRWIGDPIEWSCGGKSGTGMTSTLRAFEWCIAHGKDFWLDAVCIPLSGVPFDKAAVHMGDVYFHAKGVIPCELWGEPLSHLGRGWVQQEILVPQLCDEILSEDVMRGCAREMLKGRLQVVTMVNLISPSAFESMTSALAGALPKPATSSPALMAALFDVLHGLAEQATGTVVPRGAIGKLRESCAKMSEAIRGGNAADLLSYLRGDGAHPRTDQNLRGHRPWTVYPLKRFDPAAREAVESGMARLLATAMTVSEELRFLLGAMAAIERGRASPHVLLSPRAIDRGSVRTC
jgi:hypothetical protein